MKSIFLKELRSYFTGVVGYVFLVLYLVFAGAIFCYTTLFSLSSDVTAFYTYMLIVSAVVLPLLTMKSFSEERKTKTEQLLFTAPVSITSIVLGKFLAAYVMFAGCIILNSLYFLILNVYAVLKFGLLLGNLIALLLVGMAFIAIGIFVSSVTENQLSAAVGTIGIILGFLLVSLLSALVPETYFVRYILEFFSIFSRFQGFVNGYFDIASVVYYLSISAVFVYLTIRVYDRRRCG